MIRVYFVKSIWIYFSVLNKQHPATSLFVKGTQDIFDELFRLHVKFELGRLTTREQEIALTTTTREVRHLTTLFHKVIATACHSLNELERMHSHNNCL